MGIEAAIIGSAVLGAGSSALASSKAAKAQSRAADRSAQLQREMFERQVELQEPFRQAGLTAQNQILQLLGIGGDQAAPGYGSLARPFGMQDFQKDPGYAFRQSEGMKALERSAAARGSLLSGGTLKGIQRFGQDLASQEYQNAFNRYQVERANRLNPLQSLMGSGQSSANVLTGAAGGLGQGLSQAEMAGGAARASGYVGAANALNQALGSVAGYYVDKPLNTAIMEYYKTGSGGGSFGAGGYGSFGGSAPAAPQNFMYGGLNPRVG